jgi:hypothetical protein
MSRNQKLYITIAVWVVVGISYLYVFLTSGNDIRAYAKAISRDSIWLTATVTDVKPIYKHGYELSYFFEYNQNIKRETITDSKYDRLQNLIVGKKFPVVVNKSYPDSNYILILEDDFKAFGRSYPDSIARLIKRY